MQIEKLSDTEANILIPVTEKFKVERVSLDEINSQIDNKDRLIEARRANMQIASAEIETLRAEKAELVAKKQELKKAGMKTRLEVEEESLPIVETPVVEAPVESV